MHSSSAVPYFHGSHPPFHQHLNSSSSIPSSRFNHHWMYDYGFGERMNNVNDYPLTFSNAQPHPALPSLSPTSTNGEPADMNREAMFAQEVFFKTLIVSIREANRFNSSKAHTWWKNPFLYKTSLCIHWLGRGFCNFGLNCWYAHGPCELRFVPRMTELPTPEYISHYLSYLGLPQFVMDDIIRYAYLAAGIVPELRWPKLSKPTNAPFYSSTQSRSDANLETFVPTSSQSNDPFSFKNFVDGLGLPELENNDSAATLPSLNSPPSFAGFRFFGNPSNL